MQQVRTVAGDTVNGILYRHLKNDDDELETQFHRLNPDLSQYGVVLPSGLLVNLPPPPNPTPVTSKSAPVIWD